MFVCQHYGCRSPSYNCTCVCVSGAVLIICYCPDAPVNNQETLLVCADPIKPICAYSGHSPLLQLHMYIPRFN